METLISSLLAISAGLLAIPVIVLFVEVLAAVTLPPRNRLYPESNASRSRLAVLVPAHDEGSALLRTIADIRLQLRLGDRLLVVADNCTDDTADIALAASAEVVERRDPTKRGKGYALDFGVRHLNSDPPEIVVIIDADCTLGDYTLDRLAVACASTRRPIQALMVMTAPEETSLNYQIAEFAWRVKNWVRPLGLSTLGLPCQLMGNGMAFPWDVIRSADLATGEIVEDLKFGLEFAMAGTAPLFCPSAVVVSAFPSSIKGAQDQRRRWEQGHINMILKSVPRFFSRAVADSNWDLLVLTLDLAVPPLSLLGILIVGMFAVAARRQWSWAFLRQLSP